MSITVDEIATAIESDPAIDEVSLKQLKPVLGDIARIVGDKHDTLVVPFCEITLTLWRRFRELGCTYDAGHTFDQETQELAGCEDHLEDLLSIPGMSESQVMLSPEMGMNDEMRKLYLSGELTFGTLARRQPSVFLT